MLKEINVKTIPSCVKAGEKRGEERERKRERGREKEKENLTTAFIIKEVLEAFEMGQDLLRAPNDAK